MRSVQLPKNAQLEAADYDLPQNQLSSRSVKRMTVSAWLILMVAIVAACAVLFLSRARSVEFIALAPDYAAEGELARVDAEFSVKSAIKLPLRNRVLLLPRKYVVEVQSKGFPNSEHVFEVGEEPYPTIDFVLKPLEGSLELRTNPQVEASVYLNEQSIGTLPGVIEGVAPGVHELVVDANLYREHRSKIVVHGRQRTESLTIDLEPAWAEISVSSEPPSMLVIDGSERGMTPQKLKVEEGERQLLLHRKGFKSKEFSLDVKANQAQQLTDINLQAADAQLELASSPVGAAVIVNERYQGVSPLTLRLAPNKQHEIQMYKAGYALTTKVMGFTAEQQAEQTIKLEQERANVRISVQPQDARIAIDGNPVGTGSRTVRLTTLPHRVAISRTGYQSKTVEVMPSVHNEQLVSIRLLTDNEAFWAKVPEQYTTSAGQQMFLFKNADKVRLGSERSELGRRSNERSYEVSLTKPFYISIHEVTNRQYRRFYPAHNSGNYKRKSLDLNNKPVVNISWQDAAKYCNWLSLNENLRPFYTVEKGFIAGINDDANGYRLPTEAEWSWLAREEGASRRTYPWGELAEEATKTVWGNIADEKSREIIAFTLDDYDDGFATAAPVGRFPANDKGLFDLGGNVSEWVHDWYSARPDEENAQVDPLGPKIGEFHVVRGPSWARGHLPQLRFAYRDFGAKGKYDIGFRVARYVGEIK